MMSGTQVIRMLRGAHDPGPAFCLERREGSFSVMQHTHVPHMSHRSLLHMLDSFAAAGTDLLRCAVLLPASLERCYITPCMEKLE